MAASGGEYLQSKDGLLRLVIIIFGIIAFALVASSGYGGPVAWPFAAYLMAWILSFLFYIILLTSLASKLDCGVPFEAVDYCISLMLFTFCVSGSIVLAIYNCDRCGERIAGNIFGFLTAILYFVELYLHQGDAPGPTKYVTTTNGIAKVIVVTLGCTTYALLVAAGYRCHNNPCDSGRTYALAAFVISWSVSMIFLLLHITGLAEKIGKAVATADFIWAVISVLFYLTGSIVLACYLEDCTKGWWCSRRVASVVFGFFTTIAYVVEVILLKKSGGQEIVPVK